MYNIPHVATFPQWKGKWNRSLKKFVRYPYLLMPAVCSSCQGIHLPHLIGYVPAEVLMKAHAGSKRCFRRNKLMTCFK